MSRTWKVAATSLLVWSCAESATQQAAPADSDIAPLIDKAYIAEAAFRRTDLRTARELMNDPVVTVHGNVACIEMKSTELHTGGDSIYCFDRRDGHLISSYQP